MIFLCFSFLSKLYLTVYGFAVINGYLRPSPVTCRRVSRPLQQEVTRVFVFSSFSDVFSGVSGGTWQAQLNARMEKYERKPSNTQTDPRTSSPMTKARR